jgi:hypothetical protein
MGLVCRRLVYETRASGLLNRLVVKIATELTTMVS